MGRDVCVRVGSKVEKRLLNEGKEDIGEEDGSGGSHACG